MLSRVVDTVGLGSQAYEKQSLSQSCERLSHCTPDAILEPPMLALPSPIRTRYDRNVRCGSRSRSDRLGGKPRARAYACCSEEQCAVSHASGVARVACASGVGSARRGAGIVAGRLVHGVLSRMWEASDRRGVEVR